MQTPAVARSTQRLREAGRVTGGGGGAGFASHSPANATVRAQQIELPFIDQTVTQRQLAIGLAALIGSVVLIGAIGGGESRGIEIRDLR